MPILLQELRQAGFDAQLCIKNQQLHIGLKVHQAPKGAKAAAQIYKLLEQLNPQHPQVAAIETVYIYGLHAPKQAAWTQKLLMPRHHLTKEDTDLCSFNNRIANAIVLPGLGAIALLLNAMPIPRMLLNGINIWWHEFGHAIVAWLSGRKAIPLPIGWTNVEPERSLFVYFGILVLLGLLGWSGYKERQRWPMVLAIGLALLQVYMTWWMSADRFEMWLAFGGIGGEFYLCTLMMVSFYFPLPAYWRWDFYRYPVVLGAAFTFFGKLSSWRQIRRGVESIPWGSLWGGADHAGGDMNILSDQFGWSDQLIIDTYNGIGGWCLLMILSVYFYFLVQQNHRLLFAWWQHWMARA